MKNKNQEEKRKNAASSFIRSLRLIHLGALGVSIITVVQLLPEAPLKFPLTLSAFCFAGYIPLSVACVLVYSSYIEGNEPDGSTRISIRMALMTMVGMGGILGFFIGLSFAFASLSLASALLFSAVSALAYALYIANETRSWGGCLTVGFFMFVTFIGIVYLLFLMPLVALAPSEWEAQNSWIMGYLKSIVL